MNLISKPMYIVDHFCSNLPFSGENHELVIKGASAPYGLFLL